MKNFKKLTTTAAVAISLLAVAPTLTSTVQASTIDSNSQSELSLSVQKKLDSYVTVKNNQYVLSESAKTVVSEEEYNVAKQMIEQTNIAVANTGSVINRKTKAATNDFTLSDDAHSIISLDKSTLATRRKKYHYGVNKVTYHWNYIRVYLNKSLTQTVAAGAIGGLSTLIANYVSGGLAAFAVGAISSAVATLVGNSIKGGVWVDYNFLAKSVTSCGWQ